MNKSQHHKKFDRTTQEQLVCFLGMVKQHPELLHTKLDPHHPPEWMDLLWEKVANSLNALKGPSRTPTRWKESLRNWKKQLHCRERKAERMRRRREQEPDEDLEHPGIEVFGLTSVKNESLEDEEIENDEQMTDDGNSQDTSTWRRGDSSQYGSPPPSSSPPRCSRNSGSPPAKRRKTTQDLLEIMLLMTKRREEQEKQALVQQQQMTEALNKVGDGLLAIAEAIKTLKR